MPKRICLGQAFWRCKECKTMKLICSTCKRCVECHQ